MHTSLILGAYWYLQVYALFLHCIQAIGYMHAFFTIRKNIGQVFFLFCDSRWMRVLATRDSDDVT